VATAPPILPEAPVISTVVLVIGVSFLGDLLVDLLVESVVESRVEHREHGRR
jgi:hypothetical protein